ncbi:FGGY-family carbohydrate kinase [Aminobacter sp. AP02]|uniref:FGGY-family carbohydrate kinase n=1 Tax=Aminobacter sp. AP02 TaxID=2135737 RepID=UPI000D6D2E04|nr:FGGY-family carbohydrate kinase [Aminobacter sp. AP02]PWK69131.1 sugar (pentulose or hexulose) kinase [Aminobacter sp. AP02]
MTSPRTVAVVDIGKTNAKVALVDTETLSEFAVRRTPNVVIRDGIYPHFDCEALWGFIKQSLADLEGERTIDAISVTTHGATAALLAGDGNLAMPVLDYEHDGPDVLSAEYDAARPPFGETGTPRLPLGLNLGAQLFWQATAFPRDFALVSTIATYPQYWAFRLCGVLANETTSLGCHTDLWQPAKATWSSLVDRMGWRARMAPVRKAGDRLGTVLPDLAEEIGLRRDTPVFGGIHDSNASLYPHLLQQSAPFSVVSTGTWVIVLSVGGAASHLDPARDCLINVNALGDPVASARFMGGREFSLLVEPAREGCDEADLEAVLGGGVMLLPSFQQGSGPFPRRKSSWRGEPQSAGERFAAVSLYLAMMTAICLELTGAGGPVIVEGPFAKNRIYCAMLAAATGRNVLPGSGSATGTSLGAALLAAPDQVRQPAFRRVEATAAGSLRDYFEAWRALVG